MGTILLHPLRVTHQSKCVSSGGTFVAIKGAHHNGVDYIDEALRHGAKTIVLADDAIIPIETQQKITEQGANICRVANVRRALAELSAEAYGYPARSLTIIGITGTKGKTTTSWMLYHILRVAGTPVALLSTVMNRIGDEEYSTELTTQHPDYIHAFFASCVERGITHVVMEVAAQAITLHRVWGLKFSRIAWLNFSQEHGEFYTTEDAYFSAKADLIRHYSASDCVVVRTGDDARIALLPVPAGVKSVYFKKADVTVERTGIFTPVVSGRCEDVQYVVPGMCGLYNGENALAAILLARSLSVGATIIQCALKTFQGVPGRMNLYQLPNGAWGCIDYAHNPSSFEVVLSELRQSTAQLLVVFGCGGDRDTSKRPMMGEIAARYADVVILTTDNPRSEDPAHIIQDIMQGVGAEHRLRVHVILDREAAIRAAYEMSGSGAIIALLGKGPDEYQLVAHIKTPFSERSILQSL